MLTKLIQFSLRFRGFVLVAAGLLLAVGGLVAARTPVDVLPDLTAPSVTVLTEAPGFAPEEVELLVTFPLESVLNGAPGVRRLRSVSGAGVSVVWVEFDWGQDVYLARQIVSERLQEVELPEGVTRPRLGPVSSIMGEITFLALTSKTLPAERLRRIAETDVRRALLAIPGIAQVVPIGGDLRQYQVLLDPPAMARHGVGVLDVVRRWRRPARARRPASTSTTLRSTWCGASAVRGPRKTLPPRWYRSHRVCPSPWACWERSRLVLSRYAARPRTADGRQ